MKFKRLFLSTLAAAFMVMFLPIHLHADDLDTENYNTEEYSEPVRLYNYTNFSDISSEDLRLMYFRTSEYFNCDNLFGMYITNITVNEVMTENGGFTFKLSDFQIYSFDALFSIDGNEQLVFWDEYVTIRTVVINCGESCEHTAVFFKIINLNDSDDEDFDDLYDNGEDKKDVDIDNDFNFDDNNLEETDTDDEFDDTSFDDEEI